MHQPLCAAVQQVQPGLRILAVRNRMIVISTHGQQHQIERYDRRPVGLIRGASIRERRRRLPLDNAPN